MPAPHPPNPTPTPTYASRGGLKLRHALDAFNLDVAGFTCADLGCSTGGFTDCLLHAGAAKVFAIDTAYGELAWKLRNDPRVVVMERTNALHAAPKSDADRVDLAVADLSWTPQRLLIPAALKWLKPPPAPPPLQAGEVAESSKSEAASSSPSPREGLGWVDSAHNNPRQGDRAKAPNPHVPSHPCIITLIKPHYELKDRNPKAVPHGGVLDEPAALQVLDETLALLPTLGVRVLGVTKSPILGGSKGKGNAEWLVMVEASAPSIER